MDEFTHGKVAALTSDRELYKFIEDEFKYKLDNPHMLKKKFEILATSSFKDKALKIVQYHSNKLINFIEDYYQDEWDTILDDKSITLFPGEKGVVTGLEADHGWFNKEVVVESIEKCTSSNYKGKYKYQVRRLNEKGIPYGTAYNFRCDRVTPLPVAADTPPEPCIEIKPCGIDRRLSWHEDLPHMAASEYAAEFNKNIEIKLAKLHEDFRMSEPKIPTIENVTRVNGKDVDERSAGNLMEAISQCDTAAEYYKKLEGESKYADKKIKAIASTRKKLVAQLDKL